MRFYHAVDLIIQRLWKNYGGTMLNQKMLDEISTKINELVAQSPVKDVEKNLRVLLAGVFTKLDLVTRDEFNVQQEILIRTRKKLTELETKIAELENKPKTKKIKKPKKSQP